MLGSESIKKNSNKKLLIILISVLVIISIVCIVIFRKKDNNFKMTEIKSTCSTYDINGVVAYNKSKTSIYISNVNYCGKKDETKYTSLIEDSITNDTLSDSDSSMKSEISVLYFTSFFMHVHNV